MQLLDSGDRRLGVFLIVSVLVHGGLLWAFPQFRAQSALGSPFGSKDSVIQVVRVEAPSNVQAKQVKVVTPKPKPASQPQDKKQEPKTQPKPQSKPKPKAEPSSTQQAKAEKPATKVVEKTTSQSAAAVRSEQAEKPVQAAQVKPVVSKTEQSLSSPEQGSADSTKPRGLDNTNLMTSENGQEVAVAKEPSPPIQQSSSTGEVGNSEGSVKKEETTPPEPEPTPEPEPEPEAEPLPPLPAASSIVPRYAVAYPKGAQNEGVGGTWIGTVLFTASGKGTPVVLSVEHPTGILSLDRFAEGLIEKGMQYPNEGVDYIARVEVTFTGSPEYAVRINVGKVDYAQQ